MSETADYIKQLEGVKTQLSIEITDLKGQLAEAQKQNHALRGAVEHYARHEIELDEYTEANSVTIAREALSAPTPDDLISRSEIEPLIKALREGLGIDALALFDKLCREKKWIE